MVRISNERLNSCFRRIAKALNKPTPPCWKRVGKKNVAKIGCLTLDNEPVYGGVVIEEIVSKSGGINHPLGAERQKPSDFCRSAEMIEKAVDISKRKRR